MSLTAKEIEHLIRKGVPAADHHDLEIRELRPGGSVAVYPFDPRSLRPGGSLAGPTIMGLADAAMYAAILGQLGNAVMAVTSQMNIHFLSRPEPVELVAIAQIVRMGTRSAVLEVRLFSGEDRDNPVALVTGTYALPATITA